MTNSPTVIAPPRSPHEREGRRTSRRTQRSLVPYLYLVPAAFFFVTFVLVPLGQTFYLAFYDWNGISAGTWVGFDNYVRAFNNPDTWAALSHSGVFIITFCVIPVALGVTFAAILSKQEVKGLAFFRTVIFVPQVIASVVIGVAWRWMYQDTGTVNQILNFFGIPSTTPWLGDFTWALPAIGLVGTWIMTGLCMVLFLSGVGRIDTDLYDAAKVDGAGPFREFFNVTLPGLRPELIVATTITIIAALRTFDLVFVTTQGGPGKSTIVPGTEIYRTAFREGDIGYASTLAVILAVVIFALVRGVNYVLREDKA
jgi:raffinose/stachyose/melibiose transport system permease protein